MINGYSAEQIRAAEAPHLDAGEPLMRRAAAALAAEIRAALRERDRRSRDAAGESIDSHDPDGEPDHVILLVGSGNNGGDALFAGAELAEEGVDVTIVPAGSRMHEDGLDAAFRAGAHEQDADPLDAARLAELAAGSEVVVDAILGTGASAHPALRGNAREIVGAMLPAVQAPGGPIVIAVDIPSGINPDDGTVPDPLVLPADVTVTFGGYKAGLLLPPAAGLAGTVRLIDIGIGPDLEKLEPLVRL